MVGSPEALGVAAAVPAVARRIDSTGCHTSAGRRGPAAVDVSGLRRADEGHRAADSAASPPTRSTGGGTLRMNRSFSTSKARLPAWHRLTCVCCCGWRACSITRLYWVLAAGWNTTPAPVAGKAFSPSFAGLSGFQTP
jgi:hypothetical protein